MRVRPPQSKGQRSASVSEAGEAVLMLSSLRDYLRLVTDRTELKRECDELKGRLNLAKVAEAAPGKGTALAIVPDSPPRHGEQEDADAQAEIGIARFLLDDYGLARE